MVDVTVDKLLAASPAFWAHKSKIQLPDGLFSFTGREYLKESMNEDVPLSADMKGTQGGASSVQMLKCLHAMITGRYPKGVLYLFPNADEMGDFSKCRFNPIINDNPDTIGRFVHDTDTVGLKRVNSSYLFMRGARLSQRLSLTEKASPKLSGIPVDKVVYDEWDFMDPGVREKAYGRMGDSEFKHEAFLGNPSIPDFGIDLIWQQTDQRYWQIRCSKCNAYTCLELDFPDCIQFDSEGKGVRVCIKCGAEIDRTKGEWVAKYPQRSKEAVGRRWSQLNSATVDPGTIVRAWEHPPDGNIADVYRFRLGQPYIESENRLTVQQVYACCSSEGMYPSDRGPCCMGVDVGGTLHVVVGKRTKTGTPHIVHVAEYKEFTDLPEVMRRYNVQAVAIDLYPETRAVRQFQASAGTYESISGVSVTCYIFGVEYLDKQVRGVVEDQQARVLKTSRTESMDGVHAIIADGKAVLPARSGKMEEYAKQMSNTAKVLQEDERGNRLYRYIRCGDGQDHYYHATNYCLMVLNHLPLHAEEPPSQYPEAPDRRFLGLEKRPQRSGGALSGLRRGA